MTCQTFSQNPRTGGKSHHHRITSTSLLAFGFCRARLPRILRLPYSFWLQHINFVLWKKKKEKKKKVWIDFSHNPIVHSTLVALPSLIMTYSFYPFNVTRRGRAYMFPQLYVPANLYLNPSSIICGNIELLDSTVVGRRLVGLYSSRNIEL